MKKIIFTDLDGTLLDYDDYSFEAAFSSLEIAKEKKIPIVICTSKTRAEIEYWRDKLENKHPFISENGGAIFIPKKYFRFDFEYTYEDDYYVIFLGAEYDKILGVMEKLKDEFDIKSFIDMSAKEIARNANLTIEQAKLAKKREFEIPFIIKDTDDKQKIFRRIRENGLKYTAGGRYYHLMGNNNKGRAIKILKNLFERKFNEIYTIGIGDSKNDFSMLDSVDRGYLVMEKNGEYISHRYNPAGGIGPEGWGKVIEKEIKIS